MSVCGQTEEDSASEEPATAGAPLHDMYEQKAVSKVVRVLTVVAYLLSVSLAAILLSVYYVCVWQSPKLPPLNDTGDGQLSALRADDTHQHFNHTAHSINNTRGGNTTVNATTATPAGELASLPADPSEPPDPDPSDFPTDPPLNSTLTADDNVTWHVLNATDQR